MAQIDIGKIKPVFRGTYDNSTAYVLDDIVYYNGSSYVAKTSTTGNLPTDTTKWNILASGSGGIWNSGLSLGSAGQVVKVNSGASALEFGTIETPIIKVETYENNTRVALSGSSFQQVWTGTYTKVSASSKILIQIVYSQYGEANGAGKAKFTFGTSTNVQNIFYGRTNHSSMVATNYYFASNTQTGALTWKLEFSDFGGAEFNPNTSDDSRLNEGQGSVLTIIEYA